MADVFSALKKRGALYAVTRPNTRFTAVAAQAPPRGVAMPRSVSSRASVPRLASAPYATRSAAASSFLNYEHGGEHGDAAPAIAFSDSPHNDISGRNRISGLPNSPGFDKARPVRHVSATKPGGTLPRTPGNCRRTGAALCASLSLAACVHNATGAKFDQIPQRSLQPGEARVFFFREKVLYLAQAPAVVTAQIQMDGWRVGEIKNGGFVETIVGPGPHHFTVRSGDDLTAWDLVLPDQANVFFDVWDKTRMEGARAAGGLLVGAVAGGTGGAVGAASNSDSPQTIGADVRFGAVAGAIVGGLNGAVMGFRGRVREGEGRIWAVDLVGAGDAIPVLRTLAVSE